MSGIFGMNIKMAIYGESHGKSIGVVLDGLPPGLALDEAAIAAEMARRAPGQNALSTQGERYGRNPKRLLQWLYDRYAVVRTYRQQRPAFQGLQHSGR